MYYLFYERFWSSTFVCEGNQIEIICGRARRKYSINRAVSGLILSETFTSEHLNFFKCWTLNLHLLFIQVYWRSWLKQDVICFSNAWLSKKLTVKLPMQSTAFELKRLEGCLVLGPTSYHSIESKNLDARYEENFIPAKFKFIVPKWVWKEKMK